MPHTVSAPASSTSPFPVGSALPKATAPAVQNKAHSAFLSAPLSFEANDGQTAAQAKFISRGSGYSLFLTGTGAVLSLHPQRGANDSAFVTPGHATRPVRRTAAINSAPLAVPAATLTTGPSVSPSGIIAPVTKISAPAPRPTMATGPPSVPSGNKLLPGSMLDPVLLGQLGPAQSEQTHLQKLQAQAASIPPAILRMTLVGASPAPRMTGQQPLAGHVSYFQGHDPKKWRTGIPTFAQVAYEGVYPGINLLFYGSQQQLEYDFTVTPGADVSRIRLAFTGADKLFLNKRGDLVLKIGESEVVQHAPQAYQMIGGIRKPVLSRYVLSAPQNAGVQKAGVQDAGFEVARYDHSKPLVIDPVLVYSTFLGGSGNQYASAVTMDAQGCAYITGSTGSIDFPTAGAVQPDYTYGYSDVFITKISADGATILYSTFLGGSAHDGGYGICVDASGSAYIAGNTQSSDFPVTAGAFQQIMPNTRSSGFVAKLSASGSSLSYCTYLGGNLGDTCSAIAVDSSGSAYVCGTASSHNFPTTSGAFQTTFGLAVDNAFVTKLSPTGTSLVYSTFLGQSSQSSDLNYTCATGIALDSTGHAFVTGYTYAPDFPVTAQAVQPVAGSSCTAFVTKFASDGGTILYSTYLGGSGGERGNSIAVDTAGSAYVLGITNSIDFPTTPGAFQAQNIAAQSQNGPSLFVSKLTPSGSALAYSTYFAGRDGEDNNTRIMVDRAGRATVIGNTISADGESPNFPTTANAITPSWPGGSFQPFVSKFTPDGTALAYSSFIGEENGSYGNGNGSYATGIAGDTQGNILAVGNDTSSLFPVTDPLQPTMVGMGNNAFVAKISPIGPLVPTSLSARCGDGWVLLSWTPSPGATSYTVWRSLQSGLPYTPLATNVTSPAYADLTVSNGTTYYYVVTALNSDGESLNSAEAWAAPSSNGGTSGITGSGGTGGGGGTGSGGTGGGGGTGSGGTGGGGGTGSGGTGGGGGVILTIPTLTVVPTETTGGSPAIGILTLPYSFNNTTPVTLTSNNPAVIVPTSVSFEDENVSAQFPITTLPVPTTVAVTITAKFGTGSSAPTSTAVLTVDAPAPASLTLSAPQVAGGSPVSGAVTLTGAAPAGGVVVALASDNAAVTVPANVTVPEGEASVAFSITTQTVVSATTVHLTAACNSKSADATLTVLPAPSLISVQLGATQMASGTTVAGTVTISGPAPAGGMTIALASSSPAATVPDTTTVYAGHTQGTFYVVAGHVSVSTPVTISAMYGNVTQTVSVTIVPAAPLPTPTGLTASNTTYMNVAVQWTPSEGATSYNIYRGTTSGGETLYRSGRTAVGFYDPSVPVGTDYYYQVTAVNDAGESARSAEAVALMPNLQATNLTWTPANPRAGDHVRYSATIKNFGHAPAHLYTVEFEMQDIGEIDYHINRYQDPILNPGESCVISGDHPSACWWIATQGSHDVFVKINNTYETLRKQIVVLSANQPAVQITVPGNNTTVAASSTVHISATATAVGGTITGVQFKDNGAVINGTVTSSNGLYTLSWTPTQVGTHTLTAVATDSNGLSTTSNAVTVHVINCTPAELYSVTLTPASVPGGSMVTGTVTLTGDAMAGGQVVSLSTGSGSSAISSMPGSVLIPAGATSQTFIIVTSSITSAVTVTITAQYHDAGQCKTATLDVTPTGSSGVRTIPSTPGDDYGGDETGGMMLTDAGIAEGFHIKNFATFYDRVTDAAVTATGRVFTTSMDGGLYILPNDEDGQTFPPPNPQSADSSVYYNPDDPASKAYYLAHPSRYYHVDFGGPGLATLDGHSIYMLAGSVFRLNLDASIDTSLGSYSGGLDLAVNPLTGHVLTDMSYDIDPVNNTGQTIGGAQGDGITISTDGHYAFFASYNYLDQYDLFDHQLRTLTSAHPVDGATPGAGLLSNKVYSNNQDGTVSEYDLDTGLETVIASGGTFGDLAKVDQTNGTFLISQWGDWANGEIENPRPQRLLRLIPPPGANFGSGRSSAIYVRDDQPHRINATQPVSTTNRLTFVYPGLIAPASLGATTNGIVLDNTALVTNNNRTTVTGVPASFDTSGIDGRVVQAQMQRAGEITKDTASLFDLEWGVRSLTKTGTSRPAPSFGPVVASLGTIANPTPYPQDLTLPYTWMLSHTVDNDLEHNLGGTYQLGLTDRISSLCATALSFADMPQQDLALAQGAPLTPCAKNTLTFSVVPKTKHVQVAQGRTVDLTASGHDTPLHGGWDIVLNKQIIASSGNPNSWNVAEDHTEEHGAGFQGFVITVPLSAPAAGDYEVRGQGLHTTGLGNSGVFDVLAAGTLGGAPQLLPLVLSSNAVVGGTTATNSSLTLTVRLDAPAPVGPGGGATVALWLGSLSDSTQTDGALVSLPASVLIPTGQTSVTLPLSTAMVDSPFGVTLNASYNGYRKRTLVLLDAGHSGTTIGGNGSDDGDGFHLLPGLPTGGGGTGPGLGDGKTPGTTGLGGTTILSTLPAPTLQAVGSDTLVTLTWSAVSGAQAYNIGRSLRKSGPYQLLSRGVTGTSYQDTDVVNGTSYYYVVDAAGLYGESPLSNEATATPIGGQVAKPGFASDPAHFTAIGSIKALLFPVTPGSEMHYTLDGSTPGANSPAYSGPITLNATTTVKARGYKAGFYPSDVASQVFTVTTPPSVSSTAIVCGETFTGSLASSDGYSQHANLDSYADDYVTPSEAAGTTLTITLHSSAFDAYLTLLDPSGQVVARNDGYTGGSGIDDAQIIYTVPAGGTGAYTIEVSSFDGGVTGSYTLSLTCAASSNPLHALSFTTPVIGGQSVTGTVTLLRPATSDAAVTVGTGNASVATVSSPVTVPAGSTSATFQIVTAPVSAQTDVTITASADGSTLSGPLTVLPQSVTSPPVIIGQDATHTVPSGGTFVAPLTVTIQCATAGAVIHYTLDGSDPTSASTLYSAPFTLSQSATVKAIAFATGLTASPVTSAAFVRDALPTVVLTDPTNGEQFQAGDTVALTASASDPDGSVSGVDFFVDNVFLNSASASPYTVHWSATAGNHTLTAKATDDLGATATSAPVTVVVGGTGSGALGCGQTIAATLGTGHQSTVRTGGYNADDYTFTAQVGETVTLTLASRAFSPYLLLLGPNSSAIIKEASAQDGTAQIVYTIPAGKGGTYIVEATSYDPGAVGPYALSLSCAGSSSLSVHLTADHSTYSAPANVVLTATVTETGTTVSKVDFFAATASGTVQIGEVTTSPYTFTWQNVPAGTYNLTAVVTDISGNTATSASVPIFVTVPVSTTTITCGQTIMGSLDTTDGPSLGLGQDHYADHYTFTVGATEPVIISLASAAFDTYLAVLNANNTPVTNGISDDFSGYSTNSQVAVTLTPGTYTIEVTSSEASKTGPYTLNVICGTANALPVLSIYDGTTLVIPSTGSTPNRATISFGSTPQGTPVTKTLTLKNTGNSELAITSSNGSVGDFSQVSDPTGVIGVGQSVPYTLRFNATGTGAETATATLGNNRASQNPVTLTLTGTVLAPAQYVVTGVAVSPGSGSGGYNTTGTVSLIGGTTATGRVTINKPAPTGGVTVNLRSANTDLVQLPTSVTVQEGDTTAEFDITTSQPTDAKNHFVQVTAYTGTWTAPTSSASTEIVVILSKGPDVSLTAPLNNTKFSVSASPQLTITANVVPQNTATVSKVEFYVSGGGASALIASTANAGTVTQSGSDYTTTWSGGVAGTTYTLTAKATDSNNLTGTSAGISVTGSNLATTDPPTISAVNGSGITVSNSNGTATDSITVTLTDPTENDPSFYYSTDSDPLPPYSTWTRYTGPFRLPTGTTTIYAFAVVSGKEPSSPAAATYTLTKSGSGTPTVKITTPSPEPAADQITQPTLVKGSVSSPHLLSWKLEYQLEGDDAWTQFGSGTASVTAGTLGTFDTRLLLNGLYTIRLTAYDRSGTSLSTSVEVVVKGDQKVGYFTLTYADLTTAIAGIPITLTRTYDSRNKHTGDFGVGWTLSTTDVRLQKSGPLNEDWQAGTVGGNKGGAIYGIYPTKAHVITIALPNGDTYAFSATVPDTSQADAVVGGNVAFTPLPGTRGTLTAAEGTEYYSDGAGLGYPVHLKDVNNDGPYNPTEFQLSLPDGRIFDIDQYNGLQWIQDAAHNKVTFTPGAITATDSNGATSAKSIKITRYSGLIGAIQIVNSSNGYAGPAIRYDNDGVGTDLTKVTDRSGNSSTYDYDFLHNLVAIHDAAGHTPVRNNYDDTGRLIGTIDADGHPIQYDYHDGEPGSRRETVYDRLNHPTLLTYDSYGNVIQKTQKLDLGNGASRSVTTDYQFGDANNPDKKTRETSPPDANGVRHQTDFAYDASGNMLTQTQYQQYAPTATPKYSHPVTTKYDYDGQGRVLHVTEVDDDHPDGKILTTNTYDELGSLQSTRDASGKGPDFHYYTGLLAGVLPGYYPSKTTLHWVTDVLGHETTYLYTPGDADNITGIQDATQHVTTFGYDDDGNKTSQTTTRTNADGGTDTLKTQLFYDPDGHLTQTLGPDGAASQTYYTPTGKVDYTVDAAGRTTRYEYDDLDQQIAVDSPDGKQTKTVYNDGGQRVRSEDKAGRKTGYLYDSLGRLVQSGLVDPATPQVMDADNHPVPNFLTDAAGHPVCTTTTYDDLGQVTQETDALGHVTKYQYDLLGRKTRTTDALGFVTTYTYDAAGNQKAVMDANKHTTRYDYDTNGRLVVTHMADGSTQTQTLYDDLGRRTGQLSPAHDDGGGSVSTAFDYDKLGRLWHVTDGMGHTTTYGYDELGEKVSQTDANGRVTRFAYDLKGHLTRKTLPGGQSERMTYNGDGSLATQSWVGANGVSVQHTVTMSYDGSGRLSSKTDSSGENLSYHYNGDGSRAWVIRTPVIGGVVGNPLETDYAYYPNTTYRAGMLKSVTDPNLRKVTYDYDVAGNKISVQTPSGTTLYDYDADNRLWHVYRGSVGTGNVIATYAYDKVGNRIKMTRANGVSTSYTYDADNRLTDVVNSAGPSFHYRLFPSGKRASVTQSGGKGTGTTTSYAYDADGRLTGEQGSAGTLKYVYEHDVVDGADRFDSVGNRLEKIVNGVPTYYAYDEDDRLTQETTGGVTTHYAYDAAGQMTQADGDTYAYDFEGHVSRITEASGAVKASYTYDGDGNRIGQTNSSGVTTSYVVDTSAAFAAVADEYTGGSLSASYQYGDDLVRMDRGGVYYYIYDGLGSTRALTNGSGTVTDSYGYDAYGSLFPAMCAGSTVNPFLFNGQQQDSATGLYYLRARYYAPTIGRFLSQDPFGGDDEAPVSLHRYLYSANDPTDIVDPSGEDGELAALVCAVGAFAILDLAGCSSQHSAINHAENAANAGYGTHGPSGTAFWEAYSKVDYQVFPTAADRPQVAAIIGGSVGKFIYNNENCATRLSYALGQAGWIIPSVPGVTNINPVSSSFLGKNGDGHRYIYGARNMRMYLRHAWGKPDYPDYNTFGRDPTSADFLSGLGLENDGVAVFATDGHVGVIKSGYGDPYIHDQGVADIWKLPQ